MVSGNVEAYFPYKHRNFTFSNLIYFANCSINVIDRLGPTTYIFECVQIEHIYTYIRDDDTTKLSK